ncbi:hypothetical protein N431DRAFT_417771 [Stipitochalara longipes BDJ]|nr:hypothetical protein N431DRAFT_417771 [Stipitochalara longipes BDJ]
MCDRETHAASIRKRVINATLVTGNEDVPFGRQNLPGLESFVEYASWDETHSGLLELWNCSPNLQVFLGEGSGQLSTPFHIRSQQFISICAEIGFSQNFLNKLIAKAPLFEYKFVFQQAEDPGVLRESTPTHLEIAIATYENDGCFTLLRYNLSKRSSKVLIFSKTIDSIRNKPFLNSDLIMWFNKNRSILQRNSLLILNVLLEFVQFRAHQYVQLRLELYNLEARLGVTRHGQHLRRKGYAEVDHDFTLLNADLAGFAKKLAETELSAAVLLEHAKGCQRLVGICEDYEAQSQESQRPFSEQREEIHATIIRAELFLKNMKMAQDVLQSLSAVLYNRINKQDTNSMKTIAVVTLVFLPATFVSTVFSTGIFNFHASESPDNPRTISKYGWIYLLICVLSTALTLLSWGCWYRWGRVWLEKLQFSRLHLDGKRRRTRLLYEQQIELQLPGLPSMKLGFPTFQTHSR